MKKVLLVGNCDIDHPRIANIIESNFQAEVIRAETIDKAKDLLKDEFDLIIVNRVGAFDGKNSLELVDYVKTPIMIITNYEDHMKEAMEHGAVEGFGKSMSDSEIAEFLKKYL